MDDCFTSGSFGEIVVGFSKFHDYKEIPYNGSGSCKLYTVISGERKLFLKAASDEKGNLAENIARLQREYKLLERLYGNEHVVRCIGWRNDAEVGLCIVMEYIDGVTLTEFLASSPSFKEKKRVLYELLDALAFIHNHQVVHNDLKLENILITRNGHNVKLIDFGYADSDANLDKATGGTTAFASPELLKQEVTDVKSDIYSLGFIIKALFPHRYGLVVRRCQRKEATRRFRNVGEVRRAIHFREVAGKSLMLGLVAALLLTGWLLYREAPKRQATEDGMIQPQTVVLSDTVFVVREKHDTIRVEEPSSPRQEVIRVVAPVDYGNTSINFDSIHQAYLDLYQRYEREIVKGMKNGTIVYWDYADLYRLRFIQEINDLHDEMMPKDMATQFQFESDFNAALNLFVQKVKKLYDNKLPYVDETRQYNPLLWDSLRIELQKAKFEIFKHDDGLRE